MRKKIKVIFYAILMLILFFVSFQGYNNQKEIENYILLNKILTNKNNLLESQNSLVFSIIRSEKFEKKMDELEISLDHSIILIMGYNQKESVAFRLISYIDQEYNADIKLKGYSFYLIPPSYSQDYLYSVKKELSNIKTSIKYHLRDEFFDVLFPENEHTLLVYKDNKLINLKLIDEFSIINSFDVSL